MALGPELLTNPNFDDGFTGWTHIATAPNTLTAGEGRFYFHREENTTIQATQHSCTPGQKYRASVNVESTTGWFYVNIGGVLKGPLSSAGVYTWDIEATNSGPLVLSQGGSGDTVVTGASLKEITMSLSSLGYELNVQLVDAGGDTANLRYHMESADWATLATDTATLLSHLNAVTRAVVKGYFAGERFVEDALTLPSTGVNVEERATVVCQLASDPTKKVTVNIPAPEDTLFVGGPGTGEGYNIIDTTDSALSLYIATWEETGAIATISDGEYIADGGILYGKRTHRQSSNG